MLERARPAQPFLEYTVFSANNQQSGADLFLDNIIFTGCGVAVPPSIIKSFSPNPIAVNGTSTLAFTLTNPNSADLTGVAFTDDYPTGVVNATPALGTTTCGAGVVTAVDGGGTVSLSGGTITANSTCTVTVDVTATTSGPHTNVSGYVSATESGTNTGPDGSATATLTALAAPVISKQFAPNPILINGTSTLSFTITNPNPNNQLTGIAFLDTYPANVVNTNPLSTSTTCGGLVTAVADGGSIDFAGGTIAGGGICTVQVDVTSASVGSYANTSGTVSADIVGVGNTASDILLVEPVRPSLSLLKQVSTTATGPWTTFIAVDVGDDIYYQFTVENTGDMPLSPVSVADPTLAGTAADPAACVWPDPLPVAVAGNENHIATCVPAVAISAVSGSHSNTATAQGTYSGTVYSSFPSDAEYATTGLTLAKSVAESTFLAAGDVLHYSYLVTNSGFAPLAEPLTIDDDKSSDETCPYVDTVGNFDAFLDPGESITCIATYTIVAGDVAAGSVTNIASATIDGITSNTDSETVTYLAPPAVTKAFLPTTIPVGGTSTLTITLNNPGNTDYTGMTFTDTYPVEIYNASSPNVSTTCPGGVASATAGAGTVSLTGASLSAGAACTVSVDVTSVTPGAHLNTIPIGGVTTGQSVSNTVEASDALTVTATAPTVTKVFAPDTIAVGGTSILTITLGNTNGVAATLSANFDDNLPAGVTAQGVNGATTCPGAVDISTNTRIRYPSGAVIPAGGCDIAVDVTSSTPGTVTNTIGIGDLQTDLGNNPSAASDDLTVTILPPSISKNFAPDPIAEGGVSTLTFTVDNPNPGVALTGVAFTDTFPLAPGPMRVAAAPNGSTANCGAPIFTPLAGAGAISFSGGTILAGGTCTVTVDVTAPVAGTYSNTSGAVSSTNGGVGNTAGDTLTVSFAAPTITKAFGTDPIAVGGTSTITLTITNPNGAALTGAGVTDAYPGEIFNETPANGATSCAGGVVTAVDGGGSVALSGGTIPANGSCTVTVDVTSTTPGTHTNITGVVTTNEAPASGTASDDLTVTATAPTVSKVFAPDTIAAGGTSILTITLGNTNGVAATLSANFDDNLPAGVTAQGVNGATTCPGAVDISTNTRIRYPSGAVIPAGGCDIAVDVTSSTPGTVTNTIGIGDLQTDLGNNPSAASDDLTVLGSSSATISKTFVDTNQPHTSGSEVAIGEILTYEAVMTLTPGVMNVGVLSDFLDRGLAFVNCESISAPPTLTTSIAGGFPWICSDPQVDAFPLTSTAPVDQGRSAVFDFGTLTNSSGGNVTLTLRYRVIVLDSAGNVRGGQLDNLAYWQWTGGMVSDASNPVVIVEPELSLQKTASPTLVMPGTTITYTHTVSHTAASDTAALDVELTDDLPTPLSYVAGSQDCGLGTQNPNICSFNPAVNELTVEWTAASGFTAAEGIGRVALDTLLGNVPPGSSFTNTATLEWSSLPGDIFTAQSIYNTLSTERYYDPPDPVDIYGIQASATIRTPGISTDTDWLPATGFAPGVVTQVPSKPQGYVYSEKGGLEIEIPSIKLRRSIIGVPFGEDSWQLDWLWNQTGYLEGTAFPTWSGNTVITAHVYLPDGLPGPFVRLGELQWGDQVILHAFGRQYIYEVREVRIDLPNDPTALTHEEFDWVTLITCTNYDPSTDSYRQRLIVRAVLVRIE